MNGPRWLILIVLALFVALIPGKLYWYIGIPICFITGLVMALVATKPRRPKGLPKDWEKMFNELEKTWPMKPKK